MRRSPAGLAGWPSAPTPTFDLNPHALPRLSPPGRAAAGGVKSEGTLGGGRRSASGPAGRGGRRRPAASIASVGAEGPDRGCTPQGPNPFRRVGLRCVSEPRTRLPDATQDWDSPPVPRATSDFTCANVDTCHRLPLLLPETGFQYTVTPRSSLPPEAWGGALSRRPAT